MDNYLDTPYSEELYPMSESDYDQVMADQFTGYDEWSQALERELDGPSTHEVIIYSNRRSVTALTSEHPETDNGARARQAAADRRLEKFEVKDGRVTLKRAKPGLKIDGFDI